MKRKLHFAGAGLRTMCGQRASSVRTTQNHNAATCNACSRILKVRRGKGGLLPVKDGGTE